jgi:hypothetical protein
VSETISNKFNDLLSTAETAFKVAMIRGIIIGVAAATSIWLVVIAFLVALACK